jgi:hypothetical protein
MNPFDLRWLWHAIRGRSLTFALIFLLTVVGVSATDLIRSGLEPLALSPWTAWLAPLVLIWIMLRLEPVIVPSAKLRRWIALALVALALALVYALPRLLPEEGSARPEPAEVTLAPSHRPFP